MKCGYFWLLFCFRVRFYWTGRRCWRQQWKLKMVVSMCWMEFWLRPPSNQCCPTGVTSPRPRSSRWASTAAIFVFSWRYVWPTWGLSLLYEYFCVIEHQVGYIKAIATIFLNIKYVFYGIIFIFSAIIVHVYYLMNIIDLRWNNQLVLEVAILVFGCLIKNICFL